MTKIEFIVDDFAGPGGWEAALGDLVGDVPVIGVEWDGGACRTAVAAGLTRVQGDVREVTIPLIKKRTGRFGYIASPPCQTFSAAGKGAGRKHLDALLAAVNLVAHGYAPGEAVAATLDEALDERSVLVLHPLHVIVTTRPTWILLEQVREVLPVWQKYVEVLQDQGYYARTEVVHAEQYGVPQTRQRAILMAVRADAYDAVPWPAPTHSKFYPRDKTRLDEGVLPWVTMAQALGWGMTERPSMTVTAGGAETGGAEPFGNAARKGMTRERDANRWIQWNNYSAGGSPGMTAEERGRTTRTADQPSVTLTSKGFRWVVGAGATGEGTPRDVDTDPAPTITTKGTAYGLEGLEDYVGPAPVAAVDGDTSWVHNRPSPSMVASSAPDVVAAPGYRKPGDPPRQKTPGSVRVTVQQAGMLQSFPADYPWQGSRTRQYQQVGNAIPPLLGRAFVEAVLNGA